MQLTVFPATSNGVNGATIDRFGQVYHVADTRYPPGSTRNVQVATSVKHPENIQNGGPRQRGQAQRPLAQLESHLMFCLVEIVSPKPEQNRGELRCLPYLLA